MFNILYKEKRQLDPRSNTKYATEYYNGVPLICKKQLTKFVGETIQDVDYLCDVARDSDCIRYFHNPTKRLPRDVKNVHSKQPKKTYRTPYEALTEFYNYITVENPTGGIPQQMINRYNKVWYGELESRLLGTQEDYARYNRKVNNEGYNRLFD